MVKLFKKLDNPFLLVVKGFVAGAILFWSMAPDTRTDREGTAAPQPSAAVQPAPLEQLGSR